MASVLASPAPGPSSSSEAVSRTDAELPKRKRARTRKRRTAGSTAVQDEGHDEPDQGEERILANAVPVQAATVKGKEKASSTTTDVEAKTTNTVPVSTSDAPTHADGDSEAEEGDGEGVKSGRKRRRTRKRPRKGGDKGAEEATGKDDEIQQSNQSPLEPLPKSTPSSATLELKKHLERAPNPEQDESISQGAKNALAYVHIFHTSRPTWKFQKAKESWLLRHLLDHPLSNASRKVPEQSTAESITRTDTVSGELSGRPGEEEEQIDNSIPEVYLPLVALYLSTMQGRSKDRLVEDLHRVIAEEEALPAEQVEATAQDSDPVASVTTSVTLGDLNSSSVKGVRFAEIADQTNEESNGGEDVEKLRREKIKWKASRARTVMAIFGTQ